MLIEQAQQLVAKQFGHVYRCSSYHLFYCWAKNEKGKWFKTLLHETGLSFEKVVFLLKTMIATKNKLKVAKLLQVDREMLRNVMTDLSINEECYIWYLLKKIMENQLHPLTILFVSEGLNCFRLIEHIDTFALPKENVTTAPVINVDESVLTRYGRDLIEQAKDGSFDHLVERTDLTQSIIQVLLRKQKGHVALLGPAGVGKTAVVECLAAQMAKGNVDDLLKAFKLFEISIGSLVAGTQYRGMFEERIEQIVKAAESMKPIILFLDELHLLVGASRAEGVIMDGANMLKPVLARGDIRIIGATTQEEYHDTIAKDAALARRFQQVPVKEPETDLIIKMVESSARSLEKHHAVSIPAELLNKAIALTDQHILNRNQPDKTIDLLDSLCVEMRQQKKEAIEEKDILLMLSKQTNKSIHQLDRDGKKQLASLGLQMAQDVIGQPDALDKISKTLIHKRMAPNEEHKPIASFLFCGESGVGKTESAKAIARCFFNNEKAILAIDMAEYQDGRSLDKLFGSANGPYKQGLISKFVHNVGSGVILLDEIEKAHPQIRTMFLSLLDEGRLTTNDGDVLDARSCVVVLTTNAIRSVAELETRSIGFGRQMEEKELIDQLLQSFPREFLGRLDELILFKPLTNALWGDILILHCKKAFKRLEKKNLSVRYREEKMKDYLLGHVDAAKSGARGLIRIIEQLILQPIAMALLDYDEQGQTIITLDDAFFETGQVLFKKAREVQS